MTLPDREPLSLGDFTGPRYDAQGRRVLKGHPSTWPQEVEQFRARVAELEAALEPFADAADECDEYRWDDNNQAPVDAGQCRAARAALQQEGGQ